MDKHKFLCFENDFLCCRGIINKKKNRKDKNKVGKNIITNTQQNVLAWE